MLASPLFVILAWFHRIRAYRALDPILFGYEIIGNMFVNTNSV